MTYLERKTTGICTRPGCENEHSETSVLCEPHRLEAAARQRRHASKERPARRRKKRCAFCGARSRRYRCPMCTLQLKVWRGAGLDLSALTPQ